MSPERSRLWTAWDRACEAYQDACADVGDDIVRGRSANPRRLERAREKLAAMDEAANAYDAARDRDAVAS